MSTSICPSYVTRTVNPGSPLPALASLLWAVLPPAWEGFDPTSFPCRGQGPREALTTHGESDSSKAPAGQSPAWDRTWRVWSSPTPPTKLHRPLLLPGIPDLCSMRDFLRSIFYPAQSDLWFRHLMKLHRCCGSASLQDSKRQ